MKLIRFDKSLKCLPPIFRTICIIINLFSEFVNLLLFLLMYFIGYHVSKCFVIIDIVSILRFFELIELFSFSY